MTKKNTRSCSHKHVKAALCAAMCSVLTAMPTFAAGEDNSAATTGTTVWTKASEIMQDVYSQIISIATIRAPTRRLSRQNRPSGLFPGTSSTIRSITM